MQSYSYNENGLSFKMALVNGDPLDTVPLEPDVAENYFCQLLSIVEMCHREGVIHRDIKPNNIVVTQNNLF